MKKPSENDVSKPKVEEYSYKKAFYRTPRSPPTTTSIALRLRATRRNVRKWRAIRRALDEAGGIGSSSIFPAEREGLPVIWPGGHRGRWRRHLAAHDVRGCAFTEFQQAGIVGFVQGDAENLPLGDRSLDCVVSIRFMFHVDPITRRRILREMGRMSNAGSIIDYRHRYSARYVFVEILPCARSAPGGSGASHRS